MNKGNCILIGAGDLTISEIPVQAGDLVIAVDGGYEYCKLLEITPEAIEKKLSAKWVKDDSFVPIKTIPIGVSSM